MPRAIFITPDGTSTELEVPVGMSLMRAAVTNGIDSVIAECGGVMSCTTCHVTVESAASPLPAPSEHESQMLDFTAMPRRENSRLSCQIVMSESLDGIVLRVADIQQ